VAATTAFEPPLEPPRREVFLRGTAAAVVRATGARDGAEQATPRIRYPAAETVIALDPDVPMSHQRVAFVASPAIGELRWRVDDEMLDAHGGRVLWAPTRGRHRLVLENAAGQPVSEVGFSVR